MLKSIDIWPLVPKKLSVESSINDNVHKKSMFNLPLIFEFENKFSKSMVVLSIILRMKE